MVRRAAAVATLLLVLNACCSKPSPNAAKPLSEKGEKVYTLKGKIVARDASDNSLRIDHEAIPGFMEAMTMDYVVRGAKVGALPPDRSKVEARLHVTDDKFWVTDVRKVP